MRTYLVEVSPPFFDQNLRLGARTKPFEAQTLVAELAVEALRDAILSRLAGFDQCRADALRDDPRQKCSPAERAWIERIERYRDPGLERADHAEVTLAPDCYGEPEWRVECQDDDGACYVTIFAGPKAEQRTRLFRGAKDRHPKNGPLRAVGALSTVSC